MIASSQGVSQSRLSYARAGIGAALRTDCQTCMVVLLGLSNAVCLLLRASGPAGQTALNQISVSASSI